MDERRPQGQEMLQVKRRPDQFVNRIIPSIYLLWEEKCFLDGLMVCPDGNVPFSRLIISSHSQYLRNILTQTDNFLERSGEGVDTIQKIILDGFR